MRLGISCLEVVCFGIGWLLASHFSTDAVYGMGEIGHFSTDAVYGMGEIGLGNLLAVPHVTCV